MTATTYLEQHRDRALAQLHDLLRIPSISALSAHRPDMRRAVEWLAADLRASGMHGVEVIDDPEGGHPLLYAEWLEAPERPTVLLYGHYDVQPPDPLELWESAPFEPIVRGDDLYARGASDDKGPLLGLLKGVEALLQGEGRLPVNLKVLIEGEEETSGQHIARFVRAAAERLRADCALIADTSMLGKDRPALCTGLRGMVYTEIAVQGAAHDLHSGIYGGAAPNALNGLATILAGLKDTTTGSITVPGYYDAVEPPSAAERAAWAEIALDEEWYRREEVGSAALAGESAYSVLERTWARPTLDVNGAIGGFTGEGAKTVIPAHAMAKVSMRLVPRQDPEVVYAAFQERVQALCPPGISAVVRRLGAATPVLLPSDTPAMRAAAQALTETVGAVPALVRMGGSIPIVDAFLHVAGVPSVLAGFGLPDDNLHAPNEKFYLPNYTAAARFAVRFLTLFGEGQ